MIDVPADPPAIVIVGDYVNPNPIFVEPRNRSTRTTVVPSDGSVVIVPVPEDYAYNSWWHRYYHHHDGVVTRLLDNLL